MKQLKFNETETKAIIAAINYYVNKHGGLNCLRYNITAQVLVSIKKELEKN